MKMNLLSLRKTILLCSMLFSFASISQDSFTFPEEFFASPYSHELRLLKIKKIEQIHSAVYRNSEDSTRLDTFARFDYVVTFNERGSLASFKYDFQKERTQMVFSNPEGDFSIYGYNDTNRLELLKYGTDSTYFNYSENVFNYGDYYQLQGIEVIHPNRGGIIDGLFIKDFPLKKQVVEEIYKLSILRERNIYINDELQFSLTFEYTTFDYKSAVYYLVTKVTKQQGSSTDYFTINYELE